MASAAAATPAIASSASRQRPQDDDAGKLQRQKQQQEEEEEEGATQQQQEQEQEDRRVHEITESSSDESGDERPPRARAMDEDADDFGAQVTAEAEAATVEDDEEEEEEEEKTQDMPPPEVVEKMRAGVYMPEPGEEFYNTKNVADMHYLFTNDKLKEESPAVVLRSDPFCIPRVTDNVPNYRPMLNPLSIFLGEDKLLPGNFRLDPSERPPKAGETAGDKKDGKARVTNGRTLPAPPGISGSSTSTGKQFRGKTSAFMGTMPRQTEFAEIPVSEKLFQNHEVFRPSSSIPRVPASPPRDKRPAASIGSGRHFTTSRAEEKQVSTPSAVGSSATGTATTSASLSDAMLLSSIQHTLDVTTAALTASDGTVPSLDSAANAISSASEAPASAGYHIQQLQPLDSVADTLTNYLPSRTSSTQDDGRPVDGQCFSASGGYNPATGSMGFAPGNAGTFGSLLSQPETQASAPYPGLFVDSGEAQSANQGMQSFSTALSSISITTPTNGAAHIHAGLITPQGGVARSGLTTPRRSGAKKPRAKNVFRPCTTPGCTKGARGKSGLCQKHGGGKRCAAPNCPKGAQGSSNMCLFHGGGYRCTVEGCSTGARDATAAKRVRTDEPEQTPVAVKAD
ncbi:mitogen-activated protein kinase kinase kinase 11 [Phytophthora cinnamomi]|uniref:mitogen-activated protein kinase kinase kinase 11 n=1 Tax=Phytophthora cinnamomi TaxID=4785 RepID=UPI00355ABDA9|nr:mitogen-activated protein kinase kinase kinase 11 [Phytophthora cinnamomi]